MPILDEEGNRGFTYQKRDGDAAWGISIALALETDRFGFEDELSHTQVV